MGTETLQARVLRLPQGCDQPEPLRVVCSGLEVVPCGKLVFLSNLPLKGFCGDHFSLLKSETRRNQGERERKTTLAPSNVIFF